MRAVVQRVTNAAVRVDGRLVGSCGAGLLLLVAAHKGDTPADVAKLAEKIVTLRIFNDGEGKMNLALKDLSPKGEILAVSNFTVYGDASKQRRPSFMASAPYDQGKELFDLFVDALKSHDVGVETGEFGASMAVDLVNDGPVTLIVDVGPSQLT